MSKFGPQSAEEAKKMNWDRMDCLAKYLLKNEPDHKKLIIWVNKQDKEWAASRKSRFLLRSNDRMRMYK